MTDKIKDAADVLRRELRRLETEAEKTRKALASLEALHNDRHTGQRVRRVVHNVRCARCDTPITVGRNPGKKASFCHKPCTSMMFMREAKAKHDSHRPVTLVKGDPLKAAGH